MGLKKFQKNKSKFKPVKPLEVVSADGSSKATKVVDPTILPNTFKFAAESLKTMSERGGSASSIIVNKYKSYNYKLIFALVMNTLKNIKIIKKIMHNLKLMKSLPEDNPFLVEIMIGDLLYGQGLKMVEKNPLAVAIKDNKNAILKEQNELKGEFSVESKELDIAKYLRINHLKTDIDHVTSQLKTIGLTQLEYSKEKIKFTKFINKYKGMEDNQYVFDFHFPNDLIVIKPAAAHKLKKLDLVKKNKATFQDKASFMAVEALDVKPSQHIIDACFAPGCKTSLIATKMRNKGKILAYDLNKKRLIAAIRFLKLHGANCVQTQCIDFSQVKLKRLLKTHKIKFFDSILIDPSCSGSGIQSRMDYKKSDEEAGRLKKLQAFQVSLLKHAIRARVSKTIVYCTCSTSVEENEQVVEMALNESGAKDKWEVVKAIPYWPNRGDDKFEFGEKCVRSNAGDLTNGFFIAKLQCNNLFEADQDDKQDVDDKGGKRKKGKQQGLDENDDPKSAARGAKSKKIKIDAVIDSDEDGDIDDEEDDASDD